MNCPKCGLDITMGYVRQIFCSGLCNRENFETVKSKLIWGVGEPNKKKLSKVKPKDLCAFYLIGEG